VKKQLSLFLGVMLGIVSMSGFAAKSFDVVGACPKGDNKVKDTRQYYAVSIKQVPNKSGDINHDSTITKYNSGQKFCNAGSHDNSLAKLGEIKPDRPFGWSKWHYDFEIAVKNSDCKLHVKVEADSHKIKSINKVSSSGNCQFIIDDSKSEVTVMPNQLPL